MSLAREPLPHTKAVTRWTLGQRAFQQWLALPVYQRKPRTQAELAGELGVHENSLMNWKKKPGFWDGVRDSQRDLVRDLIPDAVLGLQIQIERGNYQAIKDVLLHGGEFDPEPKPQPGRMGAEIDDGNGRVVRFVVELGE